MFLRVERPGVERHLAEAGEAKRRRGEDPLHEPSDGEGGHLYGDHGDDEGLGAVHEEGVEEGEEDAGDEPQRPHSERPHRKARVVVVRDC